MFVQIFIWCHKYVLRLINLVFLVVLSDLINKFMVWSK